MYDITLLEKPGTRGLTLDEIQGMFAVLNSDEVYPIDIAGHVFEGSAMGFITKEAAARIDYDTDANSRIALYIVDILDNENSEPPYEFEGLKISLE